MAREILNRVISHAPGRTVSADAYAGRIVACVERDGKLESLCLTHQEIFDLGALAMELENGGGEPVRGMHWPGGAR